MSNAENTKKKKKKKKKNTSTRCRACGTIHISKFVNNVLSTNPTTVILSSLFLTKNPNLFFFEGGGAFR